LISGQRISFGNLVFCSVFSICIVAKDTGILIDRLLSAFSEQRKTVLSKNIIFLMFNTIC